MLHFFFYALTAVSHAQTIPLEALTSDDFDDIAREFSASSAFSSVAGAGTLGTYFGFEFGAIAGVTSTPGVHRIARRADPSANVTRLPTAEVYAALTVPLGLTIEAAGLPRVGTSDYKFENFALALKWTPTRVFFDLPLDLAIRAQVIKSSLKFNARVDDAVTAASFDGKVTGFEFVVSKNLGLITPFVSVGGASARADLVASGTVVFDPSFTASQSATSKPSGALYRAGLELHLLVFGLSAEYEHVLGADRFDAKFAMGF